MDIQKRIENHWQRADHRYNDYIQGELNSFKKEAWTRLIEENRPPGQKLEVLDIGTGPGFFPILLSEMGHQVTAIDCTESMLDKARENARIGGFEVAFHLKDSHQLTFDDNTFDLILCRNASWLLYDPPAAYRGWHRVLKPGGRLLIFDANWYLWLNDEKLQEEYERDQEEAVQAGYQSSYAQDVKEEGVNIGKELFFSSRRRPQWDVPTLLDLGFGKIFIDDDITESAFDEIEKIRYRTSPMFMIRAEKTK